MALKHLVTITAGIGGALVLLGLVFSVAPGPSVPFLGAGALLVMIAGGLWLVGREAG
jgi:hypothetical protein